MKNANVTGERIRNRRMELNLSVSALAEKVGVDHSTIVRYENGSFKSVKSAILDKIADALQVSVSWLLGKTDNKQPESASHLLSADDSKDICHIIEGTRQLLREDGLTFNGIPAEKEAVSFLSASLHIMLETAESQNEQLREARHV